MHIECLGKSILDQYRLGWLSAIGATTNFALTRRICLSALKKRTWRIVDTKGGNTQESLRIAGAGTRCLEPIFWPARASGGAVSAAKKDAWLLTTSAKALLWGGNMRENLYLAWDLDRVIEGLNDLDAGGFPPQHLMEDRDRLVQACINAKRVLQDLRT